MLITGSEVHSMHLKQKRDSVWQMQVENPGKFSITVTSNDCAENQLDNYLLTDKKFLTAEATVID